MRLGLGGCCETARLRWAENENEKEADDDYGLWDDSADAVVSENREWLWWRSVAQAEKEAKKASAWMYLSWVASYEAGGVITHTMQAFSRSNMRCRLFDRPGRDWCLEAVAMAELHKIFTVLFFSCAG